VDAVPRPAPTVGGWLRQIQPLLMLPDHKVRCWLSHDAEQADHQVDIFPSSGTTEVDDELAILPGSDGLCG